MNKNQEIGFTEVSKSRMESGWLFQLACPMLGTMLFQVVVTFEKIYFLGLLTGIYIKKAQKQNINLKKNNRNVKKVVCKNVCKQAINVKVNIQSPIPTSFYTTVCTLLSKRCRGEALDIYLHVYIILCILFGTPAIHLFYISLFFFCLLLVCA